MRAIRTTTISILALGLLAGAAVGVAAQDEEAAMFSGTYEGTWPPVDEGTVTFGDGYEAYYDELFAESIETTDARLTGSVLKAQNTHAHKVSGRDETVAPRSLTWRIENEGGAWTGQGYELHWWGDDAPAMAFEEGPSVTAFMLTGEGDYEGLSAYLEVDWSTWTEEGSLPAVRGAVFPGEAPPFTEVPLAVE